jgi:hypothetical protein
MSSPRRSWLYRSRATSVTSPVLFLCLTVGLFAPQLHAQGTIIQYGHKAKVDKGPRAVGLVQLPAKGKPRLIPVAVMVDGKFYDADSYKAAPVPMAVDFGTVYEAFHGGVSQGIFTITQPGQLEHTWIAEGKWLSGDMRAAEEKKKKKFSPPVIEDENGPPVLHRRKTADSENKDEKKDQSKDDKKDQSKDDKDKQAKDAKEATGDTKDKSASSSDKSASPDQKQPPEKPKEEQKTPTATPGSTTAASPPPATPKASSENDSSSSSEEPPSDPNRPRLRRGAPPDPNVRRDVYTKFERLPAPAAKSSATQKTGAADSAALQVTTYPAVSDAGGPDPTPYVYDVKPGEEESYRAKMLELAGAQLRGPTLAAKQAKASRQKSSSAKATKLPKVEFDDVALRIFDLSNSNEPVLVLSAKARVVAAGGSDDAVEPKEITLIARTNLEGELKKLFFSQTDSRHLDETPRMEIVDAVDADGDGRGELLFRRIFDNGSAYGIYRVSSDKLWPLFEGTP